MFGRWFGPAYFGQWFGAVGEALPQGRSQLSRADLIAIYEREWAVKEAAIEVAMAAPAQPVARKPRRVPRPEVAPVVLPPLNQEEQGKLPSETQVNIPELVSELLKGLQKPVTDIQNKKKRKRGDEEETLMVVLMESES